MFVESNFEKRINYVINKFLYICVNHFVFVESVVIMIVIVNVFSFAFKNVIIIQIKYCTHCKKNYHVKNKCRNKYSHLKRDRDQSNRENQSNRNDQDHKRNKKNDNDNDNNNDNNNENRNDDDENVEKFHKLYIIKFFKTLSTINVMFVHTIL